GLTGILENLTSTPDGLGALTHLVNGLSIADDGALTPLVTALNSILQGLENDTPLTPLVNGLLGDGGLISGLQGQLQNLLQGTLPGGSDGSGTGLVSTVQTLVGNLGNETAIEPLSDLVNALVDPNDGALSGLTGILENLTSTPDGLGALTHLVNGLSIADDGALTPLVTALNSILQGLSNATPITDLLNDLLGTGGALANLLGDGGLGNLLGGVLPGGSANGGLLPLGALTGNLLISLDAGLELEGLLATPLGGLSNSLVGSLNDALQPLVGASFTLGETGYVDPEGSLVTGVLSAVGDLLAPVIDDLLTLPALSSGVLAGQVSGEADISEVVSGLSLHLLDAGVLDGIPVVGDLLSGVLDGLGGLGDLVGGIIGGLLPPLLPGLSGGTGLQLFSLDLGLSSESAAQPEQSDELGLTLDGLFATESLSLVLETGETLELASSLVADLPPLEPLDALLHLGTRTDEDEQGVSSVLV
ncbi:hypothetical protein DNJ95_19075, partial [Stutzerimonas kirkiae]